MMKATRLYVLTIAIWLILCGSWVTWRLYTYSPVPGDQDFCAHNWGYQLIMIILFRLPIWIIGLLIVLTLEVALVARKRQGNKET